MTSLYDSAELYDLIAPRDAAMDAHYREAALANGAHVLELACGSGRFAVPLTDERFGDFERTPFGQASWQQVCICAAAS